MMKNLLAAMLAGTVLVTSAEAQDRGARPSSPASSSDQAVTWDAPLPPLRVENGEILHDLTGRLRGGAEHIKRQRRQKSGLLVTFWKDRPLGEPVVEWYVEPTINVDATPGGQATAADLERRGRAVLDAFLRRSPSLSDGYSNRVGMLVEVAQGEGRVILTVGSAQIILDSHDYRPSAQGRLGASPGGCDVVAHPGGEVLAGAAVGGPLPYIMMNYTSGWIMAERVMDSWGREIAALYSADCRALLAVANAA